MNGRHKILVAIVGVVALMSSACEKKTPSTTPAKEQQPQHRAPEPSAKGKGSVTIADPAKDDPATPSWLPGPEEIPGWARTSNVEAVYPGEWDRLGDDKLRGCIGAYSIKSALSCRYESILPTVGGAVATVTLCEAYERGSAFGLATCMMPVQPRNNLVGSMSCLGTVGRTQTVHGWQGNYYIRVVMQPQVSPEPKVSVEKLAAGLLLPIPSASPPRLLSYFPTAARIPGRLWVTGKHLHILPQDVQKQVLRGSTRETTTALGLDADTVMAIVAYDPGEEEKPNYVWVVEYPTAKAASDASGRYKSLLRKIKPSPLVLMDMPRDANGKPNSRYLCGTWTADQESIMNLLPEIVAGLPK